MAKEQAEKARRRAAPAAADRARRRRRHGRDRGRGAARQRRAWAAAAAAAGGGGRSRTPRRSDVTLPDQKIGDLADAAKAAGCKLANPQIEGPDARARRTFKASDYKTNPPTSGNHFPQWYEDGVYTPGDTPELGMLVHTLEHGRIDVQYKPGTPAKTVEQLEALLAEQSEGYHMLLFENTTNMMTRVAATAWGHSLTCPKMNDQVFDAIRTSAAQLHRQGPGGRPLGRPRGRACAPRARPAGPTWRRRRRGGEQPPRDLALLAAAAGGPSSASRPTAAPGTSSNPTTDRSSRNMRIPASLRRLRAQSSASCRSLAASSAVGRGWRRARRRPPSSPCPGRFGRQPVARRRGRVDPRRLERFAVAGEPLGTVRRRLARRSGGDRARAGARPPSRAPPPLLDPDERRGPPAAAGRPPRAATPRSSAASAARVRGRQRAEGSAPTTASRTPPLLGRSSSGASPAASVARAMPRSSITEAGSSNSTTDPEGQPGDRRSAAAGSQAPRRRSGPGVAEVGEPSRGSGRAARARAGPGRL